MNLSKTNWCTDRLLKVCIYYEEILTDTHLSISRIASIFNTSILPSFSLRECLIAF